MKIGLINIDWFKKSKATRLLIIDSINKIDPDFLIVNENIASFVFNNDYYCHNTVAIPTDQKFQFLNYGIYLKNETPLRASIYSKHKSVEQIETLDPYTSICNKFIVDGKDICIYACIIGTNGIKYQHEIAKPELEHFKADIKNMLSSNKNLIIAGDFNTSFDKSEKRQLPVINSREEIINFTNANKISRTTEKLRNNIDHIFVSENIDKQADLEPSTFLSMKALKDEPHFGILLEINLIK